MKSFGMWLLFCYWYIAGLILECDELLGKKAAGSGGFYFVDSGTIGE